MKAISTDGAVERYPAALILYGGLLGRYFLAASLEIHNTFWWSIMGGGPIMQFKSIVAACLLLAEPCFGFTIQKDQQTITPIYFNNAYTAPTIYGIQTDGPNPLAGVIPAQKQHSFQVTLPGTTPGISVMPATTFSFNFIMTGTSHLKYWAYTLDRNWTPDNHSYVMLSNFLVTHVAGGLDNQGRYLAGSVVNFSFTINGAFTNIYRNSPYYKLTITSAPVPGAIWMMGPVVGLAGLLGLRRRNRSETHQFAGRTRAA